VDLERFLGFDDGSAELDAPASMKYEDINFKDMSLITDFSGFKRISDYDNLQQGEWNALS
jgi:hypothetical protein